MKLTLAELIDRYTIEARKDYYGHGNKELIKDVREEFTKEIASMPQTTIAQVVEMVLLAGRLGVINADIACCEWQIRAGRNLSLEDLGQRARITRELNDYRSEIKQSLSHTLGQNIETRHYGFGGGVNPKLMTMEVQEPAEQERTK